MKIITDSKKIKELLMKGAEEIIEKRNLLKKLKSGKRLRIKHGIDPTGPKIHLGRAAQLWKLREFQELGHQIVLILGDFTAQIGDASDKLAMRRVLSEEEIKENLKDYTRQISKILDMKKTELHYNSEWLSKLSAKELLFLSMKFTAQQMIQRRNFKERWEAGQPIGLHELNYPLFQGYDSVAVKADVEIGGSDQLFNLKTSREIQKMFGQSPQDIITLKMLPGLDGRKMSTSWGNIVTIVDEPNDMYGKIMSLRDELIPIYFELCTHLSLKEIKEIEKSLKEGKINPRDLKEKLAKEIVTLYRGKKSAKMAEIEFNKIFREKKFPSKIPIFSTLKKFYSIVDLLFDSKLVSSKSEAKRVILQGGVRINGEVEKDWKAKIQLKKGMVIQVGKRKFIRINSKNKI
ncbi:MAG: tyrosine--tRNA ligase [Candidatus Nealsonbacteria bacterium CG23_combo_of_CG06-09_8_20_14_all_36_12]|uniref:Tyrosine--tRNA ligase n=2 Tax=Candidatus Nealsoniibacteriota TaxID=1817911 RepID=A0A2H0TLS6_9BACT|nr:MAG: tyrosine--tRNA ligase [Candidatus Nealsonbacteria bacterium CG23_combo_of_CG06-09_8_20_14_all_36_12]PIR73108.1 MAG: tyrosine--tRNA ligase [Candidatus Nealsonbacteria bacterium CG10_big_fil_rev_8_21_14_0_10_36_23]